MEKTPDEIGRDIAQAYLDAGSIDEIWHALHPYLAADATYLSDKATPAYKEYKVSCDNQPNCGWIIVNVDGDDVSVPIASTQ